MSPTGPAATYLKQLLPIIGPWQQAAVGFESKYTQAVAAKNKTEVTALLGSFKNSNDTFASKLSGLTPPSGAKSQQDALVAKIRQLSADVDAAKTAFQNTDVSALQAADTKIKSDTQALAQSAQALGQAVRQSG